MLNAKIKTDRGHLRKFDIIQAILDSRFDIVRNAIEEDIYCVNSIHGASGMNAPMLAAVGRLPKFLDEILKAGSAIDFSHRDLEGNDLLDAAMLSLDDQIIDSVQSAFSEFAPEIINNWPEP